MPKYAISGKGGVGKTTLSALLAYTFANEGTKVLVIDADPDANLASALGMPQEMAEKITPIAELTDLIEKRTGARPGQMGGFFSLNPRVDDIPDRFSAAHRGIRLLVLGTVQRGGAGCICPESALLKNLVRHLFVGHSEAIIMDMEAGIEHLGRGTAENVYVVGNKIRSSRDEEFIVEHLPGDKVLGFLPFSEAAIEADMNGVAIFDADDRLVAKAREIRDRLPVD